MQQNILKLEMFRLSIGENLRFVVSIRNFKLPMNIFSCHQTLVLPPELRANRRPKFRCAAVNKMATFPDIKCAYNDKKKSDKTKLKKKQTKNSFAKILVSSYYRHTEFHRFRNVQEIKKTVKIIRGRYKNR